MTMYYLSLPYEQLLLSTAMFNGYFQQQIYGISVKTGIRNYDEWVEVYDGFIKYIGIQIFVNLDDPLVYNGCHINQRQKLYGHIKNNKIEGIWCINDFITWLKRKKLPMRDSLFWVLNNFIEDNGAVIIGNKHYHKYMNTSQKNGWFLRLMEKLYL